MSCLNRYTDTYLPTTLITDKETAFTSKAVAEIAKIPRNRFECAMTKHPQTNGKIERIHASLKTNLKWLQGTTGDNDINLGHWL